MTEPLHSTSPADAARLFALIPCAGSGSRAGTAQPKQYQVIAGQPMVLHTLAAFSGVARLTGCLVVVAPSDSVLNVDDQRTVVVPCGGATRVNGQAIGIEKAANLARQFQHDLVDVGRCMDLVGDDLKVLEERQADINVGGRFGRCCCAHCTDSMAPA